MSSAAPTTLGYFAGSRWLGFFVASAALGIFFYGMLGALRDAEEFAERASVDMTWRSMRIGLQIAKGEAIMARRDNEIQRWAGGNPVRWLSAPPDGYRGDCTGSETDAMAPGSWCFDLERRELVYRPRNTRYLHVSGASGERQLLRWRVAVPPQERIESGQISGLRVEIVTPYVWRGE